MSTPNTASLHGIRYAYSTDLDPDVPSGVVLAGDVRSALNAVEVKFHSDIAAGEYGTDDDHPSGIIGIEVWLEDDPNDEAYWGSRGVLIAAPGELRGLAMQRLDGANIADDQYAYIADETDELIIVDRSDLDDLGRRIMEGADEAYSLWCAATEPCDRAQVADLRDTLAGTEDLGLVRGSDAEHGDCLVAAARILLGPPGAAAPTPLAHT